MRDEQKVEEKIEKKVIYFLYKSNEKLKLNIII